MTRLDQLTALRDAHELACHVQADDLCKFHEDNK